MNKTDTQGVGGELMNIIYIQKTEQGVFDCSGPPGSCRELGDESWEMIMLQVDLHAKAHENRNNNPEEVNTNGSIAREIAEPDEFTPCYLIELPMEYEEVKIPEQVKKAIGRRAITRDCNKAVNILSKILSDGWGNASFGILFGTAYEWGRMNGKKERSRKK